MYGVCGGEEAGGWGEEEGAEDEGGGEKIVVFQGKSMNKKIINFSEITGSKTYKIIKPVSGPSTFGRIDDRDYERKEIQCLTYTMKEGGKKMVVYIKLCKDEEKEIHCIMDIGREGEFNAGLKGKFDNLDIKRCNETNISETDKLRNIPKDVIKGTVKGVVKGVGVVGDIVSNLPSPI